MSKYKLILELKPDLSADKQGGVMGRVKSLVTDAGGKVSEAKSGGLVKLAYPIDGSTEANLFTIPFDASREAVDSLQRGMRKLGGVLRAMIVRGERG